MGRFTSETETQLNILNVKLTIEEHIAQVNIALDATQRKWNNYIKRINTRDTRPIMESYAQNHKKLRINKHYIHYILENMDAIICKQRE
jgi:hypothetical protein